MRAAIGMVEVWPIYSPVSSVLISQWQRLDLTPPLSSKERENGSAGSRELPRLDLPDTHPQTRIVRLLFLLPGEKARMRASQHALRDFTEEIWFTESLTSNCHTILSFSPLFDARCRC
jgi:hypothetical protein